MHPPSAFGTFRVLHQIGSGVLGPVFRSYDSHRERLAAIKAFKVDLLPEQLPEFAEALRALVTRPVDDSGVVRAIDSGVEGATPFLALEFVSGDPLDAILRESRPLTREQTIGLCRALGRAVDAAWEIGVGHGALHPRDVFVSDSGEVAVTGFGVAQALGAAGLRAPVRRPYSAPERDGGGPWDRRADVYSLAAIAQELLARSGAPSADAGAVLEQALRDVPDARFGTAGEFVDALAQTMAVVPPLPSSATAVTAAAYRPIQIDIDVDTVEERDAVGDVPLRPAVEPPIPVLEPMTPFETADEPLIGVTMAARPPVVAVQFPWLALVAASLACLAAGGLVGFKIGFSSGTDARIVSELAKVTTPPPAPAREASPSPVAPQNRVTVEAPSIAPASPPVAPSGSRRGAVGAKAAAGSIEVDSRPRGARVTVDGRPVGQTPLKVSAMSPGDHRVLIELTGHRRVTSTVKVTAGEPTRLAVSLEPTGGETSGSNVRKRN